MESVLTVNTYIHSYIHIYPLDSSSHASFRYYAKVYPITPNYKGTCHYANVKDIPLSQMAIYPIMTKQRHYTSPNKNQIQLLAEMCSPKHQPNQLLQIQRLCATHRVVHEY